VGKACDGLGTFVVLVNVCVRRCDSYSGPWMCCEQVHGAVRLEIEMDAHVPCSGFYLTFVALQRINCSYKWKFVVRLAALATQCRVLLSQASVHAKPPDTDGTCCQCSELLLVPTPRPFSGHERMAAFSEKASSLAGSPVACFAIITVSRMLRFGSWPIFTRKTQL
jgi:hypothetical protein